MKKFIRDFVRAILMGAADEAGREVVRRINKYMDKRKESKKPRIV